MTVCESITLMCMQWFNWLYPRPMDMTNSCKCGYRLHRNCLRPHRNYNSFTQWGVRGHTHSRGLVIALTRRNIQHDKYISRYTSTRNEALQAILNSRKRKLMNRRTRTDVTELWLLFQFLTLKFSIEHHPLNELIPLCLTCSTIRRCHEARSSTSGFWLPMLSTGLNDKAKKSCKDN